MNALTPRFRKNGGPLESFRHEMDDWTRRFFGTPLFENAIPQVWIPSVDIAETDKEVVLKADLPGVDPKDMDISVADGSLILRGHKKEGYEEKGKEFRRIERFEGEFYRELPLPAGVDPDKVIATYSKGVVTVTLPKKPAAQTKKVAIKPLD
jgi:HSP20 family protein